VILIIQSQTPAAADDFVAMFSGVNVSKAKVSLICLKLFAGTLSESIASLY
jgi:hypothetical protein